MTAASHTMTGVEYWYEKYRYHLTNMGLKLGYRNEEIDDLIHQFFLGLLEKKVDLSTIGNPLAFLSVAFRRRLIDHYRLSRKAHFVNAEKLEEVLTEPSVQERLEQLQSNKELVDKIRDAYNKLPLRCRKVIHLKFYEGLSTEQIAEQTGLSKRSVYNNLFEAVKLLRIELNKTPSSLNVAVLLGLLPIAAISDANLF
jgi:RNA polymerase sigma factor (sigma-70 family)